jgi:protein SCO1/2
MVVTMTTGKKSRVITMITVILVLTVAVFLLMSAMYQQPGSEIAQIGYPDLGGDFILQSADGPVSLHDYRGKVVVLYFGYASCPDVCPTSLGLLSLALRELKQEELDDVQVFFISVDPERDTVDRLKGYARAFHPNIMGITGSPDKIRNIARRYGALYIKVKLPGSALGYAIDHSSTYYVIDRKGVVRSLVHHGSSVEDIVSRIREALD